MEEIHKERICHQITDAHTLTNLTSINHSALGRFTDPAKKDPDPTPHPHPGLSFQLPIRAFGQIRIWM